MLRGSKLQAESRVSLYANRWDEKAGLQRDALSSQVIDALEARETRRPAMKKLTTTTMQQTLNKQDRSLTVGLDLGDRSSFYCVLDEAGDVLLEQRVEHDPQGDKRGLRSDASEPYRTGDRNAFTVGKPVA